jgi:GTP-binding protein YchF
MSYKIGLVGLPNVGKSSFFSFLTNKDVLIANYPFATIDKSVGIVSLDDFRIREMGRELGSKKITNSSFEIFDIAGLVKGASEGLGLGNEFLSSIREVDAIFHVLRCFEDKEVLHVEKSVNPVRDYEIIQTELILSDLQQVRKRIFKIKKKNIDEEELAVLKKVEKILEKDELLSTSEFSNRELSIIKRNNFLTLKPSMIIANYSSLDTELEVIKKLSREKNVNFFPISIKDEIEFKDLSEREKSELG